MRRPLPLWASVTALVTVTGVMLSSGAAAPVDAGCTPKWWPQPRQNSCASGSATNAQAPSPANVGRLGLAWTYDAGKGLPQPVVWKGPKMQAPLVYLVGDGRLHALDLGTGSLRWKAKAAPGDGESAQPAADRDLLLQSSGRVLRRYVPRSGHIVWQRTVSRDGWEPLVVADGNVYVPNEGTLGAYDERTGRQVWKRQFDCLHCGLAAVGSRLYAVGEPDTDYLEGTGARLAVYALDARTGSTLWSARTPANVDGAWPVVADDRVFVRTIGGRSGAFEISIEAFDATQGRHLWHASLGVAKGFWFTPVSADARLVVYASESGELYALDAATGALRWKALGITNVTKPAIVNGLVWAGDDEGRLVAYDARDGRRLWASERFKPDGLGSPVIANGLVLLSRSDGKLLAYRASP